MQKYDFLVIGTGIAGLTVALKASELGHSIALVTKSQGAEGSSNYAQGGIAGAVHPTDSAELHMDDTLKAGAGLCRKTPVKILTEQGPRTIEQLIEWGVQFTRERNEKKVGYHLVLEGGHSRHRILHSNDLTGKEIMRAMLNEARSRENIQFYESHFVLDLITKDNRCWGGKLYNRETGNKFKIYSKATFLATGGLGQIYEHTTNPLVASGDGMGMAFRAGAELEDMEFMQFHPTSLFNKKGGSFLISEAVRGHGGILRNHLGEAFMEKEHPLKDLAPRDIVARAIHRQLKTHNINHVYLDVTHLPRKELKFHFPNIFRKCEELGIDISKNRIPVVPAAHYMCGGIKVNTHSESSIKGLYACGEASCTGVHGANRLASNSLLESVVFSQRAWKDSAKYLHDEFPQFHFKAPHTKKPSFDNWTKRIKDLKQLMWTHVGILRNTEELQTALGQIHNWRLDTRENIKVPLEDLEQFQTYKNMLDCALAMIHGALSRKESRGLHYTSDYPQTLKKEAKHRSWKFQEISPKPD